ncbi:2TM domain-containing protein [Flavobacterium chryseum]|uniref:2TM domain-containing protein n=1 Tax=Flavobacterium sp. P3160 TaxID=2512113 RepID=UPI00105DD747|nr:2TM domain-containing protein [Flavobacterium sp. P3160]TDO71426.1 2TM domain-containing protein [Flavobacterium sp. P3160]
MGRFRRRMYENYAYEFSTDESYNEAYKKVKKIKGFYSHLKIYIIVNIIIVVSSLNSDYFGHSIHESGLFDWRTYSTALYWGIAVLIHAFTVFGPDVFFSRDWEQKKIQKYMDRDAQNKNKWE